MMDDLGTHIPWDAIESAPVAIGYIVLVVLFLIFMHRRDRAFQAAAKLLTDVLALQNARYSDDLRASVEALTKVHDSTKANTKATENMSRLVTTYMAAQRPAGG